MDEQSFDSLEAIWDGLLSREPELIKKVFRSLDDDSKIVSYEHLKKMVSEDGWHPEQQKSASIALEALKNQIHP